MKSIALTIIALILCAVPSHAVSERHNKMYQEAETARQKGDFDTALRGFMRLAEETEHPEIQLKVGIMYDEGKGVPSNPERAMRWFRLAAEQGNDVAKYLLGIYYVQGRGVSEDYVQAYKWFSLAGPKVDADGYFDRDVVELKMTPSQIAEAKKLVREWLEKH